MERNTDFVYLDTFVWDTEKNELNKKKHHISFETAVRIFQDPYMTQQYDTIHSTFTEERWKCIGCNFATGEFHTITVSMTERGDLKRIFSARKANYQEVKDYEAHAALLQNDWFSPAGSRAA